MHLVAQAYQMIILKKIRNDIQIITVDGGSEFKRAFPESMKSIFSK